MAGTADILIRILGESTGLSRALDKSKTDVHSFSDEVNKSGQSIGAFGNVVQGVFQGIGQALLRGIGDAVRGAIGELDRAVQASSDLTETVNKTTVAFGESSKDILAWSQNSATALGQSERQALDAASSFALLFKNVGLGVGPTAEMSKSLVQLAADLGSIYNLSNSDTLAKLQSGLVGETRPLRDLNIFLSETAVQQKALQLGLADTTDSLSEQDKVLARYALILQQGKIAQGDFAKTSGELANAEKILAAQEENALARIGDVFKPVKLAFVRGLSELIDTVAPYGEGIMQAFAGGLAKGIVAITPVLLQMRQVFVNLLEAHSPPKLLPELTEWGKRALAAYMEGWSKPDTDALQNLGGAIEAVLRSSSSAGQIKETSLVSRIFGSQKALVEAINQWRIAGTITAGTLGDIARKAGPAGTAVSSLVAEYFNLQDATRKVSDAQDDLNRITQRYSDALDPINAQLDAVRAKQQEIRDNQRLEALGKDLQDPTVGTDQKQLDRLEIQQIELERQATAIGKERDTAVGAAQAKADAAKKEQDAQQAKLDQAQAVLDGQTKTNGLIAEEIGLRQKLADEAKAAQDKIAAADKQRAAELERVHQAQLNFNLASTDTAGQLALEEAELAKATVGSADYYDILTRIVGLKQQLKKEQDAAGGNDGGALAGLIPDAATLTTTGKGISDLTTALNSLLAGLSGKQEPVKLSPFWTGVEQTVKNIGIAAKDAKPEIQALIDLFTGGGDKKPIDTSSDPLAGSWWLKGFIPGLGNLINTLGTLKTALATGDWTPIWQAFQQGVNSILDDPNLKDKNPNAFAFYSYINDIVIPAIKILSAGDWKDAIGLLASPLTNLLASSYQQGHDFVANWWEGVQSWFGEEGKKAGDWLAEHLHDLFPGLVPLLPDMTPNPNKQPQSSISPQSFPGGGLPQTPLLASSATTTNSQSANTTFYINQTIAANGDFGGARQGAAEGIRQALISGRLT